MGSEAPKVRSRGEKGLQALPGAPSPHYPEGVALACAHRCVLSTPPPRCGDGRGGLWSDVGLR